MTTPPNPAAAAVEKIVRKTLCTIFPESHTLEEWGRADKAIRRAIADAIAATGAREALEKLGKRSHYYCEDSYYSCPLATDGCADSNVPADECNCGAGEHNEQLRQALANLDAVCGKENKP